MEIFEAVAQGAAMLQVAGQVNSANAPELDLKLRGLLDRGFRDIVVDCSRLVHMTSAGFRSLLRADKRASDGGGRIVLCGLHGLTLELFELGGFLEMFTVVESREAALACAARADSQW
jgi:anti-anti-sigma factor